MNVELILLALASFFGYRNPTDNTGNAGADYAACGGKIGLSLGDLVALLANGPAFAPGFYFANGTAYRVRVSAEGNPYAYRMDAATHSFVYEIGAIKTLRAMDLLTYEQACSIGLGTGACAICAKELSDPTSRRRGIGPKCESVNYPNAPKRTAQGKRDDAAWLAGKEAIAA